MTLPDWSSWYGGSGDDREPLSILSPGSYAYTGRDNTGSHVDWDELIADAKGSRLWTAIQVGGALAVIGGLGMLGMPSPKGDRLK